MNINNNFSINSLNIDLLSIKKEANKEISSVNKSSLSEVIAFEIKKENTTITKLVLSNAQIDNKLNTLNEIKSTLEDSSFFDFDKYIKDIPLSTKKEESNKAMEFLNPNQKFTSQAEKNEYLSKLESSNVNVLLLSKEDREIYLKNQEKALSNDFDKKNDFDSVLNDIYTLKSTFNSSRSLSSSKSKENDENLLEKVEEKLLLASDNSTSLKEKKSLISEVKDLLKDANVDIDSKLSKKLDNIINSQEKEFNKLTDKDFKIDSSFNAKSFLEKIDMYDSNFEDLSAEDKKNYLENKKKILENLSFEEDTSYSNKELTSKLKEVLKNEENQINELTSLDTNLFSLSDAKDFLEKSEKYQSSINEMSTFHKEVHTSNKQLAMQIISDEKNTFVENIDNLINILNNLKYAGQVFEESIDYKVESQSFSKDKIQEKNGDFFTSQSSNINKMELQKLIS